MKNIKKGVGKIAAVGLISMLSLGGLSNAALAADLSHTDPQNHKESMTIDGNILLMFYDDNNNDGLVNTGDTFEFYLHIKNTSDNDYNYVDVSSLGLGLNRTLISNSLPAGKSINLPITYNVKEGDEFNDTISGNVFVNVRDETRIENSTSMNFSENITMNQDAVVMPNSKLTGLIMDKTSGKIVVDSIDKYSNYYGIDESRLTEGNHTVSVGDGYVYAFDFTNNSEETITLNSVDYINNIIEENVSGAVIDPGETANFYVISEITRDDMDWGLVNSKATVGGDFDIVVSDTNNVNYVINNGQSINKGTPAHLINRGDSETEDLGGTAEANITYMFNTEPDAPTVVVDGVNSERFGFIESSHILENDDEITVEAPEAIVLESGDSFTENAFTVYRGKYHSEYLTLNPMGITGSYSSDTGGGVGDEFPEPSLTVPVCGEEAQPILPSLDEFNEGVDPEDGLIEWRVERDGDVYNVYVVDSSIQMIMDEYELEIPAVVPCPVEIPDYEEPVFVGATCDAPAYLTLPENNEFYNYSSADSETGDGVGVLTAEVRNTATGELLDSWEFEYTNPTDCDPVVVPPVEEETPESPIEETTPPVEEDTPEQPVEEITPPVEEEKPQPPIEKEVPKKVNSGEMTEVASDDNNVAAFALITGAGVVLALTTGIVLVRSRKK